MILKNSSFKELASQVIKNNYKFIVFGAGVTGTVSAPDILAQYGIGDCIECYVDNSKAGTIEPLSGKPVYSPGYLDSIDPRKYVLLAAVSRFAEVLDQLEKIENIKEMPCYFFPVMCVTNFKPADKDETAKESGKMIIPKVIHYMWLGKNKIPEALQYCIDSWKKFCPDYEIKQWDESNYDIEKNPYMKQAYERKMYGFVPDYARLDILYNYGGIYLDTDVELKKSLDGMLYQKGFCCVEKWQTINFGGGSGAVKGNRAVGELLKGREELTFIDENNNMNKNTCGYYDTLIMQKYGYILNGQRQKILDMNIYPYEYFHPYDYMSAWCDITGHTYGIHHFNGGWLDESMREANRKTSENFEKLLEEVKE